MASPEVIGFVIWILSPWRLYWVDMIAATTLRTNANPPTKNLNVSIRRIKAFSFMLGDERKGLGL
jgi:hypothetical protein